MKVARRTLAVLVLGVLMVSGAWDGAHASAQELDSVTVSFDASERGGSHTVTGPSAEAGTADFRLPILTGACVMVALCCIGLLLASSSSLRRRRRPFPATRATVPSRPRAGHGRRSKPSSYQEQLCLSRT